VQSTPSFSAQDPGGWKSKARSPKWWLGQPWFIIGLIALFGLTFAAAARQHGFTTDSSLTNNPNNVPFPITTGEEGCRNFADYWMSGSEVGVSAQVIKDISTCRQAPDGSWFLPTGPADPRLTAGEAMTTNEKMQTAKLRADILAQIAVLDVSMPKNLRESLNGIRTGEQRAVIEGIRRGANVEPMRKTYARLAQAFLISPDNQALAEYIGWRMQQRSDALNVLVAKCRADQSNAYLFAACDTVADSLNIGYPPFIWELFNPLTLDNYLAHVVRTGGLATSGQ
jgi:hypothetical protein